MTSVYFRDLSVMTIRSIGVSLTQKGRAVRIEKLNQN